MATRSENITSINLPRADRRSVPVQNIEKVDIPLQLEAAQRVSAFGGIIKVAGKAIADIDRKNQEMAAEKTFSEIYLEAQRAIKEVQSQATGEEDITQASLGLYDRFIEEVDSRAGSSQQAEIIRGKLLSQRDSVGAAALDYELKLKAQKYDENLNATIDNAGNIVAGDPRQFPQQLKNIETLIETSRLNGADKAQKLNNSRRQLARVYLSRLSETNPSRARSEANSEAMNALIDPQFKTSLLGKLDTEMKARATLALGEDIASIEQARKLGVTVDRSFIEDTAKRARASGKERQAVALEKYAGLQEWAIDYSQKSLAEQRQEARELRLQADLGDLHKLDQLEVAESSYKEKVQALAKDPWAYYASKGIIDEQPASIVGAAPDDAKLILADRRLAQEKINELEGGAVRLPLLTPQEVAQLSQMKEESDPRQMAAIMTSLGAGMTGQERRATVAAVAKKEPMLAVAMSVEPDKAAKLLSGNIAEGMVSSDKVREKAAEKLKGVTIDPTINESLHDSIYAYYKQTALEKGETSKEAKQELIDDAISQVIGKVDNINVGRPSRIIVPDDLTTYEIEDRLNSLNKDDLMQQQGQLPMTGDGFRATPEDILRFGRFLSAGDGVVAVRLPTGTLYRDDGQLYTIDLRQLEVRTPKNRMGNALATSRTGGLDAGK